jgi:hypothetical protein
MDWPADTYLLEYVFQHYRWTRNLVYKGIWYETGYMLVVRDLGSQYTGKSIL